MGYYTKIFALATIVVLSMQQIMALRPLEGEQWLQKNLVIQSLQRGPVRASQKNPCSTIAGRSHGRCTLSQINVAGHVDAHAPPAFPDAGVKFAAASMANETQKQNSRSSSG